MAKLRGMGNMIYSALLFAPFGFWILGVIFAIKAVTTRDLALFKEEVRQMFYHKSS